MKQLLIAFIILVSIFVCSCNKQYTCECKVTGGGPTSDFVVSATKQGDAIKKCTAYSNSAPGTAPSTCNLK